MPREDDRLINWHHSQQMSDTCDINEWAFYQKVTAIGLATGYLKCNPRPVVREEGYTGKEKLPTDPLSLKIAALAQKINHALGVWTQEPNAPDSEPELKVLLTAAKTLSAKTPIELLQEARKHIERILAQKVA